MKILAIDDNKNDLALLRETVLSRLPEAVFYSASDDTGGLQIALVEDPDVILLDCRLPGFEVCRMLKDDHCLKTIPVLFMTGAESDRDSRVMALDAGGEGFVARPFDDIEITAQIRAMVMIKAGAVLRASEHDRMAAMVEQRTEALLQSQHAMLNLLEDIKAENTARMQSELAARESEAKFRLLFDSSLDVIFLHELLPNERPGLFIECNQEAFRRYGYTRDEMLRMTPMDIDAQEGLAAIPDAMRHLKRDGYARWDGVHVARDGRKMDVEIVNSLFTYQGRPMILASVRDITERKQIENERQILQKLQSVGTLAGGIAHDFNNILMGLFGNISLAKDQLAKNHPSFATLEEAEKSMNRAVRLTKQLLTFAKGGEPIKESVSLETLVEDIARFDLSGSGVKLVFQPSADLWLAEVDKGQMQQAVSNLIINARQAMPNGGCLHIDIGNAAVPASSALGIREGNYVKLAIRDEGVGIDPKLLSRIFDPYFTTKQTGSGLGLATVHSIIKRHGGHLAVVSELGKGSTFTLYLPAAVHTPRSNAVALDAAPAHGDRPARILVMDDDEMVRGIVVRMLKPCGFSVATANDGKEAIDIYRQSMQSGMRFDAVVMDLTVPGGIGGKEAIASLLSLDPQVRAIVSSGYADDPVVAHYADFGFKGIAIKPYTQSELRDVLRQVLQ